MSECKDCLLCERRRQVVMPTLCLPGGLLAIGEAPGADEEIKGEGFVGRAGRTLDRLLLEQGIARGEYGRANICRCRPVDENGVNRKPNGVEVDACLPKLAEVIGECRPSIILCVGWTPGKMFIQASSLFNAVKAGAIRYEPGHYTNPSVLKRLSAPCHVVVMPHTSPLAFNRNAPDGQRWADIAGRQVSLAVSLLR